MPCEAPDADKKWLSGIKANAVNKTRKSIISFDNKTLDNGLRSFKVPVTAVFGSYDIYGKSKDAINKRFSNLNYITIENSGHLPWIQNQQDFTVLLNDFYGMP